VLDFYSLPSCLVHPVRGSCSGILKLTLFRVRWLRLSVLTCVIVVGSVIVVGRENGLLIQVVAS